MEDRPKYVIYYLSNRLKYLEEQRPTIYHVYDSDEYLLVQFQVKNLLKNVLKEWM